MLLVRANIDSSVNITTTVAPFPQETKAEIDVSSITNSAASLFVTILLFQLRTLH